MGGSAAAGRPDFCLRRFQLRPHPQGAEKRCGRGDGRNDRRERGHAPADAGKPLCAAGQRGRKNSGRPAKRAGNADESREIRQRLRLQAPRLYELDGADGDQRRRNRRFLLPRLFPHGDGRAILHHRRNQRPAGQRRGRPYYERARAQPEDGQGHRRGLCGLYAGNVSPDDGCGNLRRRGARLHRRIERRNRRRPVKRASHGDGQSAGRGGGFFGDRPSGRGGAPAGSRRGAAGRWARAGRGEAALLLPED